MPIKQIKRTYRHARYVFYKETLVDFKEHFWAFVGLLLAWAPLPFYNTRRLPHRMLYF